MAKKKKPTTPSTDALAIAIEQMSETESALPDLIDLAKSIVDGLGGTQVFGQKFAQIFNDKETSAATQARMFEAALRLIGNVSAKVEQSAKLKHKTKEELEEMLYLIVKKGDAKYGAQNAIVDEAEGQAPAAAGEVDPPAAGPANPDSGKPS